jgi:hypothetical protein
MPEAGLRRLHENTACDLPMALCVALRNHRPHVRVPADAARSPLPASSARHAVAHPWQRRSGRTWSAQCHQGVDQRDGSGGRTWVRVCGAAAVLWRLARVTSARSARGVHGVPAATRTQTLPRSYW